MTGFGYVKKLGETSKVGGENMRAATNRGESVSVLLSPAEYEKIQYEQAFSASIDRGLEEFEAGKGIDTDELEHRLKQHIEKIRAAKGK